jgi:hypothetical protein
MMIEITRASLFICSGIFFNTKYLQGLRSGPRPLA